MPEVMRSSASAFKLPTLLQAIESELLSGLLEADNGGVIAFRRGRIVHARLAEWEGLVALYETFVGQPTAFTFDAREVDGSPLAETLPIVMEGCRLADEWQRFSTSLLERVAPTPPSGLAKIWPRLDGRRSLEWIVSSEKVSRAGTVDAVEAACRSGALRVSGSRVGPVVTDFDELLRNGRDALKRGDIAEAVDFFFEAASIRPDDRAVRQNLRHAEQLLAKR